RRASPDRDRLTAGRLRRRGVLRGLRLGVASRRSVRGGLLLLLLRLLSLLDGLPRELLLLGRLTAVLLGLLLLLRSLRLPDRSALRLGLSLRLGLRCVRLLRGRLSGVLRRLRTVDCRLRSGSLAGR